MSGHFATGHSKWSKLFPGIRTKLTTLPMNVQIPLQREFMLSCGVSSASENSLKTLLSQTNGSNWLHFDCRWFGRRRNARDSIQWSKHLSMYRCKTSWFCSNCIWNGRIFGTGYFIRWEWHIQSIRNKIWLLASSIQTLWLAKSQFRSSSSIWTWISSIQFGFDTNSTTNKYSHWSKLLNSSVHDSLNGLKLIKANMLWKFEQVQLELV